MSIRAQLGSDLEAALPPRKYRVVPHLGAVDRLAKPLVQLEQGTVSPSPGASGLRNVGVRVHVVTHLDGITEAAEDAVDALVLEVLDALESLRYLIVGTATKEVWGDTHLSYVIETDTLTRKVQP